MCSASPTVVASCRACAPTSCCSTHRTGGTSRTTSRATSSTPSCARAGSPCRGHNRGVANQKQRRRRAKEKRHAYDLVEIDSEGNETVLRASEVKREDAPRDASKGKARQSAPTKGGRG